MVLSTLRPAAIVAGIALGFAAATTAQCSTSWLPGTAAPGVFAGQVYATTVWDPDGAGPLGPRYVLGGDFLTGQPFVYGLAAFDPSTRTWSPLGLSPSGAVRAIATLPNGHLVVGGDFTNAFGVGANGVARWDGTAWHAFGAGTNGAVHALAALPNGDLVAGGPFTGAGGSSISYLARWNGASWQAPGVAATTAVGALLALPNGEWFAGSDRVLHWNGAAWQTLGVTTSGPGWGPFPPSPGAVKALTKLPNGDLVATGVFDTIQGVPATCIARWDGALWQPLGAGIGSLPVFAETGRTLAVASNGDLIVGGSFATAGGAPAASLARWDGAAWSALASGASSTTIHAATALPGGELLVGGSFAVIGGIVADNVARWDGALWHTLGEGFNGAVMAMTQTAGGDLVVGGGFTSIGGRALACIARWDGTAWQPLGTGLDGTVLALTVLPGGDVVAGGTFTTAGGAAANRIARWDGALWHPLGSGMDAEVRALATMANGDLVAGGIFLSAGSAPANRIARWDGTAWQPLGSGTTYAVEALATLANGDLVAGGQFTHAGGVPANCIARWDGAGWQPLGAGMDLAVLDLARLPDGDLVAAGSFTTAGGAPASCIARWDGAAWHALGAGIAGTPLLTRVMRVAVLPNGDLVAGGEFTMAGGGAAARIARWNGTTWQPIGAGMDRTIESMLHLAGGDLAVGGSFTTAGGTTSTFFARLATSCGATVSTLPTPCVGPAGPFTLVADSLPWTGATYHATATGFTTNALGASVLGFSSPASPLSLVLPLALPGCTLLASGDSIVLTLPSGGVSGYQFTLPNDAVFAGLPLFHQFLQLALDPQFQIASSSASNGLALVIGAF
jgi:hypothetical protein